MTILKVVQTMKNVLKVMSFAMLAACSAGWETTYDAPIEASKSQNWNVRSVTVGVPEGLTTTEDNTFTPNADVVWHGEPFGNRKAQAAAILQAGITQGARPLRGSQPVTLNVVLQEFHAVTPKARAEAPSAVHNISYTVQVLDARTGEPLIEPQLIRADLEAFTGQAAYEAFTRGETQKVRITNHLKNVTAGWLGIGPDPRRGFSSVGR